MKKTNMTLVPALILLFALALYGCRSSDYKTAKELMSAGNYAEAAELFGALGDYSDAAELLAGCENELAYAAAAEMLDKGDYENAHTAFAALGPFRDAADKAAGAKRELDYAAAVKLMDNGDFSGALELLEGTEGLYDTADRTKTCRSEIEYADAVQRMDGGDFAGARELFASLGDFRDAADKAETCSNELDYAAAAELLEKGDYEKAYDAFTALSAFRDAADKAAGAKRELDYAAAVKLMDSGDFSGALELFEKTEGLYDTADRTKTCRSEIEYADAAQKMDSGDFAAARELFASLGDFRDAADKAAEAKRELDYAAAVKLMDSGDYAGALKLFEETQGLYDTADRTKTCRSETDYAEAIKRMDSGDFAGALELFASLGDFRDAAERAGTCSNEVVYAEGKSLMEKGDYSAAYEKFMSLRMMTNDDLAKRFPEEYRDLVDYLSILEMSGEELEYELDEILTGLADLDGTPVSFRDSGKLAVECKREMTYADALAAYGKKDYETAYPLFSLLGDFRDAEAKAAECYDMTVGTELRAAALGDGDILERWNTIIRLKSTDPATAAKGAYKLIGEYDGADQKWEIGRGIFIDDLLELCEAQGYADCFDVFAKRVAATVKYDPSQYYSPGVDTVINTAGASKLMIEKLLPALVNAGWFDKLSSGDGFFYSDKMQLLSQIFGLYITFDSADRLDSVLTARTVVSKYYKQLTDPSYGYGPRYMLADGPIYDLKSGYGGTVPAFSGTATVSSTAGKYLILSRDMNYEGSTTPSSWEIDYAMMFALEPDNIPAEIGDADFIVTVENTWSKGNMLYAGAKSVQAYDVTSAIKLYTADGRLVTSLGSAVASSTSAFVSENAVSYYTEPDRAKAAKLLMQNWFGLYN